MQVLFPGKSVEDLSEYDFMVLLQATSTRAANHAVVRNYAIPFSGPQCYVQRRTKSLLSQEPRVSGQATPARTLDFMWLQCAACEKWRRVDKLTGHFFENKHWHREVILRRRRELLADSPTLAQFLTEWREISGAVADDLTFDLCAELFMDNGFSHLLDPHFKINWRFFLEDVLRSWEISCEDVTSKLNEYWSSQSGVKFACSELSNCSCHEPDDWSLQDREIPWTQFSTGIDVVVFWRPLPSRC